MIRPLRVLSTWTAAAFLAVGTVACASSGGTPGAARANLDVITTEELQADANMDLLTLIQRIRPRWLQTRGSMSFGGGAGVRAVVDGVPRGGAGDLRGIRALDVAEVRYMNASDATTRFGLDMTGGAVLVTMRR
jgi:hypothetical protein